MQRIFHSVKKCAKKNKTFVRFTLRRKKTLYLCFLVNQSVNNQWVLYKKRTIILMLMLSSPDNKNAKLSGFYYLVFQLYSFIY